MVGRFTLSPSRPAEWQVSGFDVDYETVQQRIHSGLQYIMQLIPSAKDNLIRLLRQNFPSYDHTKVHASRLLITPHNADLRGQWEHFAFVDNLLKLRKYTSPELVCHLPRNDTADLSIN